MAIEHLTDDDYQEYLSNPAARMQWRGHMEACEICQAGLKEYEMLWSALAEEDAGFELSPDFADSVVDAIPVPEVAPVPLAREDSEIWSRVAFGTAAVGIFVALAVFTDFYTQASTALSSIANTVLGWSGGMDSYREFAAKSPVPLNILIASIVIVLLFGGLDRIQNTLKRGKAMLMA